MAKKAAPPTRRARALHAVIDGTCSLRIPDVPSPPPLDGYRLRCEIEFSADRLAVTLHGFDPLSTPAYEARVGFASVSNTTTVRLRVATRGTLAGDGHVEIPVVLHVDHSFDAPLIEEDSDLPLTLTTRAPGGRALDRRGRITLVGEGRFEGGHLSGRRCTLTYDATVAPLPW
jgi:hypothetical protein